MVDYSGFDLTHSRCTTCHEGQLIPVLCREIYPNDTFNWTGQVFLRFAPMVAPMMQDVDVRLHAWFVPNRLVFDGWEDFITGGKDGTDSQLWPYITAPSGGFAVGSLADHLGFTTGVTGLEVSALPFRAYDLIVNEWYKDEDVGTMTTISKAAGSDTTTTTDLQRCSWGSDRFTRAFKTAQKGPVTYLPLGVSAPVVGTGALGLQAGTTEGTMSTHSDKSDIYVKTASQWYNKDNIGVSSDKTKSGLETDLSEASAVSLDDFNIAVQIKRFLQKNLIGGSRYVEAILNHFDKRSSDARLQRPEFLGGGKCMLDVSEILQTSSTDATSPQGNMAGRGVAYMNTPHFLRNFEEHGWVIVLMSIRPRASYSQGLEKQFQRKTRFDYAWPVFSKLGMQAIKNSEVAALPPTVVDSDGVPLNEGTFAYEPRDEELRHIPSTFTGQFKTTLAYWHQGRIFDLSNNTPPQFNETFITCTPDKRVFAVTDPDVDECMVKVDHIIKAVRPFPKVGYPGPIGYMG